MDCDHIIKELKKHSSKESVKGMERFGINPSRSLGVAIPILRKLAKQIGRNHDLSLQLWSTGIHEARILASMIEEYDMVTERQMEEWVAGFDSWDVCDQCCGNLFDKTKFIRKKIHEWSKRKEEYVKRASFAMIAWFAFHDRKAKDSEFIQFLSIIKACSTDERKYVKKAVNWALRQIGKRNMILNKEAIRISLEIQKIPSTSARWIASDALRELRGEAVKSRLVKK